MDVNSVVELVSVGSMIPATTVAAVQVQDPMNSVLVPVPVQFPIPTNHHHQLQLLKIETSDLHIRSNDRNAVVDTGTGTGHTRTPSEVDDNASDATALDTSMTDALFPFIDELCLETKNIARFGVKLVCLKVMDKKKFDHIMEESDEYARIYKLYSEAFELNAGKKLIQALQTSGNTNVVEFLKQSVDHPTLLLDIQEIQQQQPTHLHSMNRPVKNTQIQHNPSPPPAASGSTSISTITGPTTTNFNSSINSSIQSSISSNNAATTAAAATLLLLDSSHNNCVNNHSHTNNSHERIPTNIAPAPMPVPIVLQNQIQTPAEQNQQTSLDFEDLIQQSLGVSIPQCQLSVPTGAASAAGANLIRSEGSSSCRGNSNNKKSVSSKSQQKQQQQCKRKKKAAPEEWEKNRNKLLRMQGQEYMGYKKSKDGGVEKSILIVRQKRSMGPPCSSPKCLVGKCTSCSKFSEKDREDLFNNFWLRMNWEQRKIYVSSLVDVVTVKRHKKNLDAELRRTSSLRYMLKLHGEKQRVCKSMFLSTLGIGDYSVRSWVLQHGGFPDPQGQSAKRNPSKVKHNSGSSQCIQRKKLRAGQEGQGQDLPSKNTSTVSLSCVNNCTANTGDIPSNISFVSAGDASNSNRSASDNNNSNNNLNCAGSSNNTSVSSNNNNNSDSEGHFIVKDYFDSLVKMPQDYLNIV